jgi:archaellum biogenesis protein FlaJ (TadC family)
MLKKQSFLIILLIALVLVFVYTVKQGNSIIREHLVDKPKVTLSSLDTRLTDVETKVSKLNTEFTSFQDKLNAQASQANAAKSALQSLTNA